MKFGILRYPHQNVRYFDATQVLLECEFEIMMHGLELNAEILGYETVGGIELFCFKMEHMEEATQAALHRISSNFILFAIDGDELRPMNQNKTTYMNKDLSSILKYSGKTNEDFTAMMINVGIFSSAFSKAYNASLRVLDPMCGRGTTLYEGLIKGYHVAGVEISSKSCHEIDKYLKRYLKHQKLKHASTQQTIVANKKKIGVKHTIETADTVAHYKQKDRRTVQFANGNTLDVNRFYKKETFHTIVTDIPYGVQHRSSSKEKPVDMIQLLEKAAHAWKEVLKKGGTVVLSYNAYTLSKETLKNIFERAGYEVLTEGPYNRFEHWVEQAVNRDVFVAKK